MKLYCRYCLQDKPMDDFHKKADAPYGRNGKCKECKSEYDRRRREMMPEKFREWRKRWRDNNLEYRRAWDRAYNKMRYQEQKRMAEQNG